MRFLAGVTVLCVMAASGLAMAQPAATSAASPENVVALYSDGVSGAGKNAATIRDPLEEDTRTERKKNAFLYVLAAAFAAIGTSYTLTRKYGEEEEE